MIYYKLGLRGLDNKFLSPFNNEVYKILIIIIICNYINIFHSLIIFLAYV